MEGVVMSVGLGDRSNSRENSCGQWRSAVKCCEQSQLDAIHIHKTEDTVSVLMGLTLFSGTQDGYMRQNCIAGETKL